MSKLKELRAELSTTAREVRSRVAGLSDLERSALADSLGMERGSTAAEVGDHLVCSGWSSSNYVESAIERASRWERGDFSNGHD